MNCPIMNSVNKQTGLRRNFFQWKASKKLSWMNSKKTARTWEPRRKQINTYDMKSLGEVEETRKITITPCVHYAAYLIDLSLIEFNRTPIVRSDSAIQHNRTQTKILSMEQNRTFFFDGRSTVVLSQTWDKRTPVCENFFTCWTPLPVLQLMKWYNFFLNITATFRAAAISFSLNIMEMKTIIHVII